MPLDDDEPNPFQTPVRITPNLRKRASQSSIKLSSAKRRRTLAMLPVDVADDLLFDATEFAIGSDSPDRFVPLRPKTAVPLNATPRTNRISRQLGLTDRRVLHYKDTENVSPARPTSASSSSSLSTPLSSSSTLAIPPSSDSSRMFGLLRKNASQLFKPTPSSSPASVTQNLSKSRQCVLTLDGPGISDDPFAFPISWSRRNLIAVSCNNAVFYQNLDNKMVSKLCEVSEVTWGQTNVIEWGGEGQENVMASGTTNGAVMIWDAERGQKLRDSDWWSNYEGAEPVGCVSWFESVLAVGYHDGHLTLMDVREKKSGKDVVGHKGKVLAAKWSTDGSYLASSDDHGSVYIWDKRGGKHLTELGTQSHKMRHIASVKALAWCPWQRNLLATGGMQPDGKINIWNAHLNPPCPTPLHTISLDTTVFSLHWSPHCKELLSTHGPSFSITSRLRRTSTESQVDQLLKPAVTPLSHSITVHEYPSKKRLLALKAHLGPVSHSCLSPDGEKLFTVCPKEETIKMWHVWGKPPVPVKKESSFDKCAIR